MSNIAIFYGSSTGNTESVAEQLAEQLGAELFDVANSPADKLGEYNNLIFGTSTWGIGDLQDDWEDFISELESADLNGKTVALFGLGDSGSYADSFVEAMAKIYDVIKEKGCKIVGAISTDGYEHEASEAVVDGKFVGLAIDEENQGDLTEERISNWVAQIKADLN